MSKFELNLHLKEGHNPKSTNLHEALGITDKRAIQLSKFVRRAVVDNEEEDGTGYDMSSVLKDVVGKCETFEEVIMASFIAGSRRGGNPMGGQGLGGLINILAMGSIPIGRGGGDGDGEDEDPIAKLIKESEKINRGREDKEE